VVDEDAVIPSTDSDLLLPSPTQYTDKSEKDTFSSQLPVLTSTYARQRPHSPELQVSLSPRPSRSRTSTAPLSDLDILLSSAAQQTNETRISSSSPPRTPKHTRHRSQSPVHHASSSLASASRTHAAAGIFARTYNLPSRSDLVSLQTITILEHLKTTVSVHGGDNNLVHIDTILNPSPQWILHGYVNQHLEMDEIVKRFHKLVKFAIELEAEYEEAMLHSIRGLIDRMNKVRVEGKIWNTFISYVKDLLKEEADKLHTLHKDHIETLCRSLVVTGCIKMNVSYETKLNDFNDSFTREHSIDRSYEHIKRQAFKAFNADMKKKWKPEDVQDDKIANEVLDQHLEKLEIELSTDPYVGVVEEKLVLLPPLLLRAQVFCGCRSLCFPLFDSSAQILEQIQHHTVVCISTPTGSGKSTLVPALLAADGYNLIFVTQPRRLACSAISARVNKTMDSTIASWAVSGERSKTDSNTRIILARTCDGVYYAYYQTVNNRPVYPKPQICQSNLTDVEFSLRKSPFEDGLHSFKQYLPDAPEKEYLDSAVRRLQHLNILDHAGSFTPVGNAIAQLPDFGNVAMNVSVYFGLTKFNCGRDIIRLAAFLSVMNTAGSLRTIPDRFKQSDEGDFMTLLSVMNHLKSHQNAMDNQEFLPIAHQLRRALARLKSFENFFEKASPQLCEASEISAHYWPNVARSLLAGYWEHVYVCMKELNGSNTQYYRYNISDHEHAQRKQIAAIDYATTIDLKSNCPTVVLARDVFCGTDRRGCILSFVGIIQSSWLDNALERKLDVTPQEREHFLANIRPTNEFITIAQSVANTANSTNIELIGNAGDVLDTERFIRQKLQRLRKWHLVEDNELNNNPTLQMNVRNVRKNLRYFNPLIWGSLNEKQVVVKMEKDGQNSITISVNSREEDGKKIKKIIDMFVWWLRKCVAVRNEHSGVIPKFLNKRDAALEERIARVTDSERTQDKRMMMMRDGTRESRMEVVAWVAVCKFKCRLEGGFPRDWIVDHRREHPTSIEPTNWVTFNQQTGLPELTPKLIPADLDFHLPLKKYFDLERFLDEMHQYEFQVKVFQEPWRYILLFDQYTSTGPFIAEFIQPHIAITQDRIDFNTNNLYVECDYTKQLGQKIDLQVPPYSIDLDSTVADIRAHKLIVLRPEDDHMNERIKKMTDRGYVLKERRFSYMPNPLENKNMVLTPVPPAANDYTMIKERFKEKLPQSIIELIEQVHNPNLQRLYEAQKT
ncbi:unnamed protein product, partial [Didymodactylos carnosus]